MIYLLDSNICIYYLNGKSPHLRRQFESKSDDAIRLCSIVRAELLVGVLKHAEPFKQIAKITPFLQRFSSLPFDDSAAQLYASLRSHLEKTGQAIGPLDMLIAAIALTHNVTLVTHNIKEFKRVKGLVTEDWF